VAELVDARDSKSRSCKRVRVQFPPWAPDTKSNMENYLIVHYGELGLKGGNKAYFEDILKRNLMREFRAIGIKSQIQLILGRFVVKLLEDFNEDEVRDAVMHVPGIEYFLFTYRVDLDFEKIADALVEYLPRKEIEENGWRTFCVRVKKSQEGMPFDRMESERDLGAVLLRNDIGLSVKMKGSDLLVFVECFGDKAYVAFGKNKGLGGLPVGTGGKLLGLISSGFDSPVAAFKMMRRGAKVDFVHFSGQPYAKQDEIEQVKSIVKILARYQGETKLFIVPFGEIQKKISMNLEVPAKLRVVLYRRLMFRIAEKIAWFSKSKGLVTGESFGQVASQTLNNMVAIDNAVDMPVFRPLVGMDKADIINDSRVIGTHDISALPCTDTCSLFMPKSPEVSAKLREVEEAEMMLKDMQSWINESLEEKEIVKIP
jgi:tRNA uracil 4-sulfurtransferase